MSKKITKKQLMLVIFVCLILITIIRIMMNIPSLGENYNMNLIKSEIIEEKDISTEKFQAKVKFSDYVIQSIPIDDTNYLFLPRSVDISNLIINYNLDIVSTNLGEIDKQTKTVTNNFKENNQITLISSNSTEYKIKVMQSDVPSICINVDNATVEQINEGKKDVRYQANLQILGADEEKYNINGKSIELKGRGNSTWGFDKKPYQIKFEEAEDLLGINGRAKKWILLANYIDKSLVKNKLNFDLQQKIGLSDSIKGTFVDLYINGEFLGNYTLCDKVDIDESRVNLKDPQGVIGELDIAFGNIEPNKLKTKISEATIVIKEAVAKEGTEEYTSALKHFEESINKFEEVLYKENPDWNEISKLIDVDSFLKYYFLIELAEDPDRFITSTFLYKDGPNDVIHIGPVWDADLSYGFYKGSGMTPQIDYTLNMEKYRGQYKHDWYNELYRNKEFVKLLNEMYQKNIYHVFRNAANGIDNYVSDMSNSIEMNFKRWHKQNTMHDYYKEVEELKKYIKARTEYMKERYSVDTKVLYTTYVKNESSVDKWRRPGDWEGSWKIDGQCSGMLDAENHVIEDIKIHLANSKKNQNIMYDVHVNKKGWLGYKYNGNSFGTAGSNTINAIKIELEGMPRYKVAYRVYMRDRGWQEWKHDGEIAGIIGEGQVIEGLEIKIEKR